MSRRLAGAAATAALSHSATAVRPGQFLAGRPGSPPRPRVPVSSRYPRRPRQGRSLGRAAARGRAARNSFAMLDSGASGARRRPKLAQFGATMRLSSVGEECEELPCACCDHEACAGDLRQRSLDASDSDGAESSECRR